jgi:hypothetical protein
MLVMPIALAKTILYVPFDDRPVSVDYAIDTVKAANVDIIVPPTEYLASRYRSGQPEKLWQWVNDNASQADALVLSADALIYGGLVDSRVHDFSQNVLDWRLRRFNSLSQSNPNATLYVFSTIMRSPHASEGGVEPAYYEKFGTQIFQLTALLDKAEVKGLTLDEQAKLQQAKASIPPQFLDDWLKRRTKNFKINAQLLELTKQHKINYFVLGRDDTSPFSQSHKESRTLNNLATGLSANRYRSFPGADQLGMIMLARAYNQLLGQAPLVEIRYPIGAGAATIPSYEDQPIGSTITDHIVAAGGRVSNNSQQPDLVLAVNTPLSGHTAEAETFGNIAYVTNNMRHFVTAIAQDIQAGKKVAVADIAFANGSDNALMKALSEQNLLDKLNAYSGWNTASNTLGYAIGQGMMSMTMDDSKRKHLLAIRYLDDWAYQANIRGQLYKEIIYPNDGSVVDLEALEPLLNTALETKLQLFTTKHLWFSPTAIKASYPWNRMFEIKVELPKNTYLQSFAR